MSIQSIKLYIDKKEQIFALLSQLTSSVVIDDKRFENIVYNLNDYHNIYLYIKDDKVVGMITLLIEQKLIHNGACVVHIEDLVVDKDYNSQGIATKLINFCFSKIQGVNYYKVIVDCTKEMKEFYEKFGFEERNIQMAKYI